MLTQLLVQTVILYFVKTAWDEFIQRYLRKHAHLFNRLSLQEGGVSEFRAAIRSFPKDICSISLLWPSIFLYDYDNSYIFSMCVIAEVASEIVDLSFLWKTYKTKNNEDKTAVYLGFFHHFAGILCIVPLLSQFANTASFKMVALSLLGTSPFDVTFYAIYKTRDINDLQERTQFAVSYYSSWLLMFICRMLWFPLAVYQFVNGDAFRNAVKWIKIVAFLYCALITFFNVALVVFLGYRGYLYLFDSRKDTQKKINMNRDIHQNNFQMI
eukprot:1002059_1